MLVIGIMMYFEEGDGGLGVIAFFLLVALVLHAVTHINNRSRQKDWMYEIDRLHQHKKELTPHKMDSINERIHLIRYENKSWFLGQYIPDAIDTLSFFEINNEVQLEIKDK